MADTTTDNTSGIFNQLGTINANGTVSIDPNSAGKVVIIAVAGITFIVVVIIAGVFFLRRTTKKAA